MTNLIETLWLADNLPIQDGLYRADGAAYGVRVDASVEGGLKILAPLSLEEFLSHDPEMVTSIDTTWEAPLPDGGYLCCGEGSYGSEGFFGRLDQHRNLIWVVYLENSNPFIGASSISSTSATFMSSAGVAITASLGTPEFGTRADG